MSVLSQVCQCAYKHNWEIHSNFGRPNIVFTPFKVSTRPCGVAKSASVLTAILHRIAPWVGQSIYTTENSLLLGLVFII